MATCTHAVGTADTGLTPNTSGAFSPSSSDLLVVFVVASGTTSTTATLSSSAGMTFTQYALAQSTVNTSKLFAFVSDSLVSDTSSQTVTFDSADAASGSIIFVCRIAGITKTGTNAIRQSASADSQAGSNAPNAVFSGAALTGNPTLSCYVVSDDTPNSTAPTGWTVDGTSGKLGYTTPTTGGQYAFRDSGFTGTDITWNTAAGGTHGIVQVEIDSTAASGATVTPNISSLSV